MNFWNIAFIEALWVDEPLRNQGIGSRLLSDIEREAKKPGYTVYCTLEDCPNGHSKYKLQKRL